MKEKNIIFRFIIVIFIISFLIGNKLYFSDQNIKYVFDKNNLKYKEIYNELAENYDLIKENNNSFIYAEVLDLSINKINNLFLINKGTNDGIKENSFVVNKDGLIGIIKKAYNNFSVVRMITSNKTNISVEINECFGSLKSNNNNYYIEDLINCSDVKIGDSVFTSKYNYSSSNILVGKVSDIKNDKIYIKYSINPYKIRYIGVINDIY